MALRRVRFAVRCAARFAAFALTGATAFALTGATTVALAQQSTEDLAKSLANPVAALISVPLQLNWDRNIGPARDGDRYTLNIQPVVPFSLNADWNIVSRTILPVVSQSDIFPGSGSQRGLGDVVQSVFLSPTKPTASGWIWGAGPVFLLPTATNSLLGADKWGAGPTAVALRQNGAWTYGALGNHLWSVAGKDSRADVSATFLQPFVSYTTNGAWTFNVQSESTYDWTARQWSVPVAFGISKVVKIGDQLASIGGGAKYLVEGPSGGPHGWSLRMTLTLLFPK